MTSTSASLLPGKLLPGIANQLLFLGLAFLIGSNLVWYFIPPEEFIRRLFVQELGLVAGISLWSVTLLVYLDLAFVQRIFCSTVCPYGRIQLMTMDRNTLTLEFDPARKTDCIRCGSCLRVCPTGIDIRNGLQIECINCGRCLDACRGIMKKLDKTGLIHYTFGSSEQGGGRPLNPRSLLLGSVGLILAGLLITGIVTRKEASLKLRRSDAVQVKRLPDGKLVNFFTVSVENRSRNAALYNLSISGPSEAKLTLLGPVTNLQLAENDNRRIDLVVQASSLPSKEAVIELHLIRDSLKVATMPLTIIDEQEPRK